MESGYLSRLSLASRLIPVLYILPVLAFKAEWIRGKKGLPVSLSTSLQFMVIVSNYVALSISGMSWLGFSVEVLLDALRSPLLA